MWILVCRACLKVYKLKVLTKGSIRCPACHKILAVYIPEK